MGDKGYYQRIPDTDFGGDIMTDELKYFHDDIYGLGALLSRNWKLKNPTTKIYYREESDPNSHNFAETAVLAYINEGEAKGNRGGMSFDHLEQLKKNMYIYVASLDRKSMVASVNEIMRILVENRFYPFNEWDVISVLESKRVLPAYRYFQWVIKVELTDVIVPYPSSGSCFKNIKKE